MDKHADDEAEVMMHAVMLSELPHVGERTARRIARLNRERGHGWATFFRLPAAVLRADYRLHEATVQRLAEQGAAHETHCRWLLDRFVAAGGNACFVDGGPRPRRAPEGAALARAIARLKTALDPAPAVLYVAGAVGLPSAPTVAVLNSRTVTESAVSASLLIVRHAAAQGFALVGGGMKAAYRITAVAGRAADLPRVILLDRGMFVTFGAGFDLDPFGFGPGRAALDGGRTMVLSPFRLMDHAAPGNGRRRDELVAALADVVIAVHARPGGEIERVCLAALDRGQCVLSWYGENAGLVAAGAAAIGADDLEQLGRYVGA